MKGKVKVCSGQHYVEFEDGTSSWGSEHPKRYPIEKTLHKFIILNGIIQYWNDYDKSVKPKQMFRLHKNTN